MCPSLNMYVHAVLLLFLSWLLLLLPQPTVLAKNITANIANVTSTSFLSTKPDCQPKCGNLSVPYPFGIGLDCSFDPHFVINCSNSVPFLGGLVVLSISPTQVRIRNVVASMCYNKTGAVTNDSGLAGTSLPYDWPYTFSDTANKLTVVGCDDFGELWANSKAGKIISACGSNCSSSTDKIDANCTGIGCCQTDIPKGLKEFEVLLSSFDNHTQVWSYDKCGYAFMGEQDSFNFSNLSDLSDPNFVYRVPKVLDFAIGNQSCVEAQNSNAYLCETNTSCSNNTDGGSGGYRCSCKDGYKGNPYLSPGCIDIDECEDQNLNDCDGNATCTNTPGSFNCSCNYHFSGDGRSDGRGCTPDPASQISVIKLSLAITWCRPNSHQEIIDVLDVRSTTTRRGTYTQYLVHWTGIAHCEDACVSAQKLEKFDERFWEDLLANSGKASLDGKNTL